MEDRVPPLRPQKPLPEQSPQWQAPGKRRRFGCLGCLGIFLLGCLLLILGGYYSIFHTSLPLGIVERMLESSGAIEIEGLSGSLSRGFHTGKISIKGDASHPDKVSSFENVEFRFNGIFAFFQEEPRLIIEEFSVGSGTIYAAFHDTDHDAETVKVDQTDAPAGNTDTPPESPDAPAGESEVSVSPGSIEGFPKEIRVDLVQFTDLKFIDVNTGAESRLGKFSMKDFQFLDGEIRNVGEYEVAGLSLTTDRFQLLNLSGSPDSGFHLDRIGFKNRQNQWSQVEQLTLEFNGLKDMLENHRFVIDRFAAESGVFYIDSDQWTSSHESREEAAVEAEENQMPGFNGNTPLKEFAIKEFELADLKFINSDTSLEFAIQKISVRDLQFIDQRLARLGDIAVMADHLEFHAEPGTRFSDQPTGVVNRRFFGVLGAEMHEKLLQDIPFDFDYCVLQDGTSMSHLTMFRGGLEFEQTSSQIVTKWHEFTLTEFLAWDQGLMPSKVNGEWTILLDPKNTQEGRLTMSADSTIELGNHEFKITKTGFNVDKKAGYSPAIPFQATILPDQVTCRLRLLNKAPFVALEFEGVETDSRELFSRVFFDSVFADLTDVQQSQINKNLEAVKAFSTAPEQNSRENNVPSE